MLAKKLPVETEQHGGRLDHLKSGLRTTNEDAHFPEEDSEECGFD